MNCKICSIELKLRKTKPYTATKDGQRWFDYYRCPKCGVNYSKPKEEHNHDSDHSG